MPRPICILSVGRSGTSLAARVLGGLGFELGPEEALLPADRHNPRGYFELREMNDLNDEILAALGGSLWSPPPLPAGWHAQPEMRPYVERARELVAGFENGRRWAFKDTRTIWTLPLWREVIGEMDYVLCARAPHEVVASLGPMLLAHPPEALAGAWLRANARALRETAGCRRIVLHYEEWFADPAGTARRLAAFAGVTDEADLEHAAGLFDPRLRRQQGEPDGLPVEVRAMDAALRTLAAHDDPAQEALAAGLDTAYDERVRAQDAAQGALVVAVAERDAAEHSAASAREEAAAMAERMRRRQPAPAAADTRRAGDDSPEADPPEAADDAPPPEPLAVAVPPALSAVDREVLESVATELGPWLQGPFPLGGDLEVGGPWRSDLKWGAVGPLLGRLSGERTLDVGSNAGFDAFMLRQRGAGHVLAIEPYGFHEQAAFLESLYGTGVELRRIGWQALDPEAHGRFDVVHCGSLLFREPHVIRLLLKLRTMVADGGRLLLGTVVEEGEAQGRARFVRGTIAGDPTWWWVPDELALEDLLRATGFEPEAQVRAGEEPLAPFGCAPRYVLARAAHQPDAELVAAELPGSEAVTRFPIGHFYSPAPDPRELAEEPRHAQIWPAAPRETLGIDWRDAAQLELLERFAAQPPLEFADEPTADPADYFTANDQYPPLDAWLLAGVLQHLRPRRMIEVGSGFPTLVGARINRERLDGAMRLTCIEPNPRGLLVDGIPGVSDVRVEKIQDTPLEVFDELGDGDVLFIETSHVVKTGSDVWWLFSEVLPRLAPGVHVHIHNIFLPGDYPESWAMEGWGWNEIYLVQAFLAFNQAFEVTLGAYRLWHEHADALVAAFPGFERHVATRGGGSLWLRRR